MYAIEFQTQIRNGLIEIPKVYQRRFKKQVRVILLAEEKQSVVDMIDQLLHQPLPLANFKPFTREEIYARN